MAAYSKTAFLVSPLRSDCWYLLVMCFCCSHSNYNLARLWRVILLIIPSSNIIQKTGPWTAQGSHHASRMYSENTFNSESAWLLHLASSSWLQNHIVINHHPRLGLRWRGGSWHHQVDQTRTRQLPFLHAFWCEIRHHVARRWIFSWNPRADQGKTFFCRFWMCTNTASFYVIVIPNWRVNIASWWIQYNALKHKCSVILRCQNVTCQLRGNWQLFKFTNTNLQYITRDKQLLRVSLSQCFLQLDWLISSTVDNQGYHVAGCRGGNMIQLGHIKLSSAQARYSYPKSFLNIP